MTTITTSTPAATAGDEPEMAFGEPWQAEAFATALQLSRNGLYRWSEWVEVFSRTIRERPQRPDETLGEAYYRQWLGALETLLQGKSLLSGEDVDARQALWHLAYLHTPHGQPVSLQRVAHIIDPCATLDRVADPHAAHHHHGHAHGGRPIPTPITVVPGAG
ncbi:nitrile hydratase accessory protein [Acerihabitans arboris]|uniref:Nitrile hydratase accessory protein n=1 Tax=Acerihabitans arboris TaxID=2691583 RepID=A0A845SFM7_9GAMM|nr:nitrile hydratase accessory protein [Acerihabitans arboris]NDL62192.1 nitrile hydratase accessory protein [Acerihabitans arboris]